MIMICHIVLRNDIQKINYKYNVTKKAKQIIMFKMKKKLSFLQ